MKVHVSQTVTFEELLVPDGRTQAFVVAEVARRRGFHVSVHLDSGLPLVRVCRLPVAWRKNVVNRWRRRASA